MKQDSIRTFIVNRLASQLESAGVSRANLSDEFNLVDSGLLDSFGFVDLLSELEEEFGVTVDFGDRDPREFTKIGGLVEIVARGSTRVP